MLRNSQITKFLSGCIQEFAPDEYPADPIAISKLDTQRYLYGLTLWYLVQIEFVGPRLPRDVSESAIRFSVKQILSLHPFKVIKELEALLTVLRGVNPLMMSAKACKTFCRSHGVNLTSPTFHLFRGLIGEFFHGNVSLFKKLNIIVQFLGRLTLRETQELGVLARDSFINSQVVTPVYGDYAIELVRSELRKFTLNVEDFSYPKHSSGATVESSRGSGLFIKHSHMLYGPKTAFFMNRYWNPTQPDIPVDIPCVLQDVPKSLTKRRLITVESTDKVYIQHSVRDAFDKFFQKHPSWGIDLHSQQKSRDWCLIGNITGEYATIDLSCASDSVTNELLRQILPTKIWRLLQLCRTSEFCWRVGKGRYSQPKPLQMYAGMGNATTFPVESLVFSAIIRAAQTLTKSRKPFRVYGDDLIVHRDHYHVVLWLLSELGFTVNASKSFAPNSFFHEACGVETYLGEDVTPTRIPRGLDPITPKVCLPHQADRRAAFVTSAMEFCNALLDSGLFLARRFLLRTLLDFTPGLPFSLNGTATLHSYTANPNSTSRTRWNKALQRTEYKFLTLSSETIWDPTEPSDTTLNYWEQASDYQYQLAIADLSTRRRPQLGLPFWDFHPPNIGVSRSKLRWKWMALYELETSDPQIYLR